LATSTASLLLILMTTAICEMRTNAEFLSVDEDKEQLSARYVAAQGQNVSTIKAMSLTPLPCEC
jgi:hypothetical protein